MTIDRIYGLALLGLALLVWYLFYRADDEVEASVTRALGPVVPLEELMHEQASAEAYDDLPDMDVEAGITYGPTFQSDLAGKMAEAASFVVPPEADGWWRIGATVKRGEGDTFYISDMTAIPFDTSDNAGVVEEREAANDRTVDHFQQRKAWADEWEARLAADFGEGSR